MINFQLVNFCPTTIYSSKVELDEHIQSYIDNVEYEQYTGSSGYRSVNLNILGEPELLNLSNQIKQHFDVYTSQVLRIKDKFRFTTSWLSLHNPGDFSPNHYHHNAVFSGVVYLRTPNDCGEIVFSHKSGNTNRSFKFDISEYCLENSDSWYFNPQEGDIFFFPSTLDHYTKRNLSNEKRICVAFNFFPVGKLGQDIGEIHLT
jgi:uncharacterized protein (TIGR02466 family)